MNTSETETARPPRRDETTRPRRLERGRGAFAMAAGMLALFALACGPPARAEVLVSNIGQNGDGRSPLINTSTPTLSALFHAQGFTTGNNDAGYTLTSIDIYFHNTEDGTTPTVTLHEGSPTGTLVDTLTGPANVSESETFTASSNIILDPRTSYFVVLQPNSASGVFLSVTDSDNEDATGETDWRIDDLGHYQYIQPILQPYLEWLQAKRIRVNGEIIPTNTAPTSSPGTVQATEDTAYTFAASDFNFSDADTGDTLSSVKVETLPANGSLTLSGAAVSANATVTKAQLDNGDLKYTPPADGYGDSYASFMFKVNDGTVDSASAYTMTINVMNVNDAPTGAPAIVGEPKAGVTLSLDFSGVADADGLPAVMDMEFTWAHTDNASVRLGTESTYLLSARDVGKNIYVYVEYTDAGGTAKESIEISSWPATGAIVANAAPTASPSRVDVTEDMAYTFTASDFSFSDADTGDTLSSVKIETLPLIGSLTLSGAAVSANSTVTRAQLDNGELKYTPAADGYGVPMNNFLYASFRFSVNDGTADSAIEYPMDINIMNVNDPPTGALAIVGEPKAGVTLSLDFSGVVDADGLPAVMTMLFRWAHTDNDQLGLGNQSTYLLSARDVGKNIKVFVEYEDMGSGKESIETSSWPATGTIVANATPTASNGTVDVTEDMAYTFAASDFNFSDADTGDTLSSVKVETLPLIGSLTLSGAAVSAMDTVTKAQLDNGELKYTPAADGYGNPYASFMFKVNDGAVDSADAYTMTINVTNVNDAPTGAPAIVGEPEVGVTLSLDFSGVVDADGLPAVTAMDITWFHTDNPQRMIGTGSTYALVASDLGKNLYVYVEYTDLGGTQKESLEISSWPATGTIVDNTNADPTVANEIPNQEAVAGMSFSYQFPANTFNDADTSDTLGYEATKADGFELPTWLSFDAATRTFSGTPASTDTGTVSVKVLATDSSNGAISDTFDILVVPALTLSFEDSDTSNLAEGNSLDVPVLLSGAPGREVTITLSTFHVGGTTASDYTTSSLILTFGAAETSKVVTVTATDDSEVDPDERLFLYLPATAALPTGILLPSSGDFKIIDIVDNDFQYQASHAGGTTLAVNEQAGTLTATVRVEAPNVAKSELGALNENVVLSVSTADGTATAGQDYTSLSQTLTFAPSDFTTQNSGCPQPTPSLCARADKTVTLAITDDTAYEGATAETFTLTLSHETDQRVTYPSPAGETATVSIADNERPELTFTVAPTTILENAGTATVTLATTDGTGITADTAIALSLAGTATKGADYTISSESLTLAAGQSSVTATITATMDTASDDNETVVVTASSGGAAIGTAQTVTITETLATPTLTIAVDPASIAEAAGTSTVTVSTGTAFTDDQTIALTLGGTATVTSDYTISSTSLTLTAGATSVTTTVTAVQDTVDEPDETVIVTASNGVTAIGSATVTITDDDAPGTIVANAVPTSSPSEVDVTEDMVYTFAASDFSFSDTDTGDTLSSVKVETLPALGSLTLSGAAVSAMDTVTKAQLDNGELRYTPAADGYGNDYATFLFRVNDGTADSAIRYPMDIDVMNVNDAPTGALAIVGEPTVGVTLSLDFSGVMDADGLPDKFEISWFHTDNNNRSLGIGSTYELIASDLGKNIKVRVEYEDDGGGKESIETASWPATGAIVDSNNEPTVANEIPDQEAVAGTSFSYQVPADTFNDADDDTLTYTANKADDASMLPTWLSFDAATRTFSGTPATTDLGTDSLQVTADDSNGGTANDIFDILVVPALTLSFENNTIVELAEGNSVQVPVVLSGAPGREVTITLSADPSRGTTASDYTTSSLILTFGASETRKVVTVTATEDSEVDIGEVLNLRFPAAADLPTGIQPSGGTSRTIYIADNDFQYQASHAGGTTLAVNEQAGTLTATVRVEAPNVAEGNLDALNENVVLSVSTADGTATAGQDYTLLSQTLTFAPSDFAAQTSGCPPPTPVFCMRADKTVTLAITDDTAYEGATAETFTLTLSHATDQRVTYPSPAGETATVSIADNERPALTFTVAPTTILENAGTATVTLATTDGAGITADQTIALSLAGTATKGTDYTISSESLTLAAGQSSVTATITATMDTASDDNETVVVTASSGGAAIGTAQTVTITETLATPTLTIAVDPASIAEAAGTSTVTVSTGTAFTDDQTIALTLGGTATVTSDYTISSTSLTLTAGATSVTTTVTAVQDTVDEPDETVIVTASNGVTAIGSATVTITDDDAPGTIVANAVPTSSPSEVDVTEDMVYTFAASDFSFSDTDTGDTLSSVKVETLPALGSLTLSGAAVSAMDTVTKAQLDNGELRYTPAADGYGNDYATFLFRVNDGTADSAIRYPMDIDVMNVNDAPTGALAIVGEPTVGVTLSLDFSGVMDADGLPDKFEISWFHTDNNTKLGSESTYELTQRDLGKNLTVSVEYEDMGFEKERIEISSWPATGAIVDNANSAPVLDNAIPDQSAVAGTAFSYQVPADAFSDPDSDTLAYAAIKADDSMLPTWMSFDADTRTFSGMPASTDTGTVSVKVTVSDGNGGSISDEFDILVVPALTVSLEEADSYVAEGNSVEVPVLLSGAPERDVTITLIAALRDGLSDSDYMVSSLSPTFGASETRKVVTVTATDDSDVDPGEYLVLSVSITTLPTGIGEGRGSQRRIYFADNDFQYQASHAGGTTLSVNEQAGTLTATVRVEAPNVSRDDLDALNENVVLSVSTADGTATAGQDYTLLSQTLTFAPADFATTRSGCPQPNPNFCARADKTVTLAITDDTAYEGATAETFTLTLSHESDQRVTYPSPTGETATVSIADDDNAPTLSVAVDPASIAEAAGTSTVTVTASGSTFTTNQTISLTLGGTATETTDYTIGSASLTLAAGATSVTTTVSAVQDTVDEPDETVIVSASNGSTAIGSATVTITDDDDAPTLSIAVDPASIAEAAGTSTVTVSTGATSFATEQTISLTLGGTATETDDFTIASTSLTLAAGATSVTTTVSAVQDTVDESNETVIVTADNGPTAIGSATATITDDDAAPTLTFSVSAASIDEAAGTSTLTVGTGTGSTFETAQTIALALSGTAAETDDFTIASTSLTLPAGAGTAASSATTTVTAVQDRIDEADETVLIDASRNSNAVGTQQTVTITDDDAAPVLSLEVSASTINEDGGTSTVTVGTGTGSTFETAQTITLTLGGTATETTDYTIGSKSLTLPAGAGTAASEITTLITAADDDFFEGVTHEQLTLAGTQGGASFGATRSVTITENEDAPKLTLSFTDDSISENGGSTAVTASVSPRTVDAFTVSFAATPDAPATAADYGLTGTLSFAALSATPTGTVTITANNNRVDRPNKSVSVSATSSQSYFRATDAVELTIEDEDAAPAPVLQVSDASIAENAGVATVTVTTGDGSTFPGAMTVTLTMTGAAGENADYTILSKSLTLPAGSGLDISMISTTVTGVDDIIDDDAEDILVDAAIGASAVGTQQTVTIDDDDAAPVLEISVSVASIAENGGTSTVTVGTGTGSTFATDQAIELSLSGTAAAVSDYSLDTTLTLPAGVGVNAATVTATVTGVDDRIDDDAETILIDGARAGAGFGTQQTVTIDDDDAAPVLVLTAQPASIAESGGVSTLTVGTGTGSTFATEQTITLAVDGTAIEDSDYTVGSRTLTLPAGVGSAAASVTTQVTGLDDGLFEGDEDQTVRVAATHAGTPAGTAQTVAVVDDEANSQVVLLLSPASIGEDDGLPENNSQITASVSPPAEHAFVVDLEIEPNAPATAADFTTALPVPLYGLLSFAAEATQSTGFAFIYPVGNDLDTPDKTLTVSGSISGFDPGTGTLRAAATTGILAPAAQTLTIRDDDEAADTVSLSLDATSVTESGGATPIEATATLASGARESAVTVTLTVGSGTGDAGAESGIDFDEVAAFTITIPAGDASASAGFSLTPVDDRIDEPDEALSVTGVTDDALIGVPEAVEITIADNDDAPELTLEVLPAAIAENGGTATVTVSTGTGSTFADEQTIELSVAGTATMDTDYTISAQTLTLPAGAGDGASSVTATVTALDDNIDDDAETIVVGAQRDGAALGAEQTVTITDDDGTPLVTLVLTPPSIAEDGGVSTVTATVSPVSATAFTVAVASAPVSPAGAGDFGQSGTTLSFAAGAAASTGSVTINAVDNTADTPNLQVSVSGTVSSSGVSAPAAATLTILDDDTTAVLTLAVDATTIAEDGGAVTVTVTTGTGSTFDSAQAITLVLGGTATQGADYTVSATDLTLPAGSSSVTATVTGLDDGLFEGGETVLISGLHDGAAFGAGQTVTIADDEAAPEVTLVLTPDSIAEDGGTSTVTATLSSALTEPFTVTVAVEPDAPALPQDYELSGDTLSFAAEATMSTGEVTIAAVDNNVDQVDKTLQISGAVSLEAVAAPAGVTLTIGDDDEASSTVTLTVAPQRIDEGAAATEIEVTGALDSGARDADTVLSLLVGGGAATALPGVDYEPVADFSLTIPANETSATATFTLAPLEDRIDEADETVIVTGISNTVGVGVPETVEITLADNDDAPVLALEVDPARIAENGGTATVTVTTGEGSTFAEERTIALEVAGTATQGEDYRLDSTTVQLPAGTGTQASAATVTVTGLNDGVAEADETILIGGTLDGVAFGTQQTVVIEDDEGAPQVTLVLTPASIGENGDVARVTASVSPAQAEAFTVTVSAVAVDPAVAGDFTLAGATLSFAAEATASTGEVTITAVDNDVDAPDKMVTVSGSVSQDGVTAPADVSLTIVDDDEPETPVVTLVLTPASIGENGGVGRVTATASPASAEAFTVTVSAVAVDPAVAGDFTLAGATLSFAAEATASTGEVTIMAVDNDVDAPDKMVTVSGSVSQDGVTAPADVSLTIVDDDEPGVPETPVVTLVLTPASIGENGGVGRVTATASPASAEAFTVTVSAVAVDPAVAGDFTLAGATLSFAAEATASTGEVTIMAVDNDVDAPDKMVTVSGSVSQDGVTAPADVSLTIVDDDEPGVPETPVVTLVLTPASIGENGGVGRVTATASPASAEAFTVTVSAVAVDPAVAGDFTLDGATLSFAADATASTGEVTITAVDNDVDAPDKMVTVSGSVSLDGVTAPADVSLTIADDDEAPVERGVDISLTALTIDEGDATGGSYTLNLIAEPSEAVIVSVSAPSDVGLTVAPARLTFTAANWSTAQKVTVTAAEDDDAEDRRVTLTHSASGAGYENVAIDAVTVTILDQIDPEQPSVSIADARGAEADGELVFELTLSRAAGKAVSVRYETRDGTARAGEDYEAGTGTATVVAGEAGARIVVPLSIDLFREADETFEVILTSADGARLDDASATGTIEDAAEDVGAPEKLLARFGRIAGGHVMTAIGDQISVDRLGGTGVTLAGAALTGNGASGAGLFGGGSFTAGAATLDQFGLGGFGLAAAGGDSSLPVAGGNWLAQPGKSPFGGNGLAMGGRFGDAGGDRFGRAGAGRMDLRELLANSAFLLNGGQDGGFSIWGRGNYTRFDNFGEGIQSDGDAVTATLGVDWSCANCRLGIALSRTVVEASYGESGRGDGELESTITGLYPYLSLRISDRFSVWGLAGQGQGELSARSAGDAPAQNAQTVDLRSRLAGFGARGEFLTTGNGFSLAVKTDAMYSRTSTEEAEGLLEAEGEYRRVRLGLEGAWLRPIGKEASLRSSFEVAAREDAGDAENGLGVEVAGGLEFSDLAPGLSLDVGVRGLVSHESEDYEEWGVSGGFRYDPRPGSVAGPLVSLSHSSGPADGGGLHQALWHDRMSRGQAASFESRRDMLSAEFAYGFKAFGALGVPWARIGTTGMGRDYRLGYSLLTRRGIPSLEFGQSAFGRELRLGWEFSLRCHVQMAVQLLHTTDSFGEREDTGIELRFRSFARRGTSGPGTCGTLQPLFTSGAPR